MQPHDEKEVMDARTKKALERAGWTHGSYADFLQLTPEEKMIVDMRIAATLELERQRRATRLSQAEVARRMGTRQPNVSALFRNPGGATLDTLCRALAAYGLGRREIAACLS